MYQGMLYIHIYISQNMLFYNKMRSAVETHLCKLRGILRSCMKQNKDAVWSLVLLLVTGVRADPKYSYSHGIILCT